MRFFPDSEKTLGTNEWARFKEAGVTRAVFNQHVSSHVNPLLPTPHRVMPALAGWLLGHGDLDSGPRCTHWPGRVFNKGNAEPNALDRFPRFQLSPMLWVSTLNAINVNPSPVIPVITRTGRHDVIMTMCPTAQQAYITATKFIEIEGVTQFNQMRERGGPVYEAWP